MNSEFGILLAAFFGISVAYAAVVYAGQEPQPIAYELPSAGFASGATVIEFKSRLDPLVTCFYIPQDKLLRCVRPSS